MSGHDSSASRTARVLVLSLVVFLTANATAQITPFTEEASVRGVDYVTNFGSIAPWGYGLSLADLDNDNDPDLITTGASDSMVGLFRNDGTGHFTDRTYTSGIGPTPHIVNVIAFDYDNDGDLDLFLVSWNQANRLYRNDGNFNFTNVTATSGLADLGLGVGSCAGDYDGDGWVDLYLTNHTGVAGSTQPNRLYRNNGNGTFTDVAGALGVAVTFSTFQTVMTDIDRDGDCDIYVSNGKGGAPFYRENNLYENVGGTFIDRTFTAGTAAYIDSMGVGIGDFDGNGYMDLYCTNVPFGNPLFLNNTDGTFTEASIPTGTATYRFGWGAHFFDFDNDTLLDLHVCNWGLNDVLYRNTGTWPVVDVTAGLGLMPEEDSTSSAVGDLDGDGDLDLVVQQLDLPVRIFINHEGQERNWLKVKLIQPDLNIFAIGATIDVTIGGTTLTREINAGHGYKSQNPSIQHFGLGSATLVDEISVIWPGGLITTYSSIAANQTVVLTPTGVMETTFVRGDANGDGGVDVSDAVSLLEHLFVFGSIPCRDAGDANDDGSLDISDAIYVLSYLFGGGATPAAPFPDCGADPTPDGAAPLSCATGC